MRASAFSLAMLALVAGGPWQADGAPAPTPPASAKPEPKPAPARPEAKPEPKPAPAPSKPAAPASPPAAAAPPAPPPKPEEQIKLTGVQLEPAKFLLKGRWASQTLLVIGRLPDGSTRDFTAKAELQPANPKLIEISKEAVVRPLGDGDTTISVAIKAAGPGATAQAQVSVKDFGNDAVDFPGGVMPILTRLGCNLAACHGSARGKGGLRFSMFAADPAEDYAALAQSAHGRRTNKLEPPKSLFLVKATAGIAHGGGQKLQPGSPEYNLLVSWVAQGAPFGDENAPRVTGLKVFPEEQVLSKGETQQLLVSAVFSDGAQRDVTREALVKSADAKVASVFEGAKLKAEDFGESVLTASYRRQSALARLVVPQPLPAGFPNVAANNKIDELVLAKLKKLGIPPSELAGDADFLRRVYLDAIGTLPAPDEIRAFLADRDPQKRSKVIDRLLERDEFVDFWTLKWSELLRVKSEYPVNVWPKAVQAYYRWVHASLAANKPYDQFVRELVTSHGSNFRSGPANFFRAIPVRNPQGFAETTALIFMGVRLNCVRCHGHPTENWTLDDNMGLAAFFTKVAIKSTQEWKEEIVWFNADGGLWDARRKIVVKPQTLGGQPLELDREEDPRAKLAEWLTSPQNPWFARNIANRVWYWLMGRGIVHEPDDLRPTNPPENPALLDYLQQELIDHKFDLKHLFRLVLNSRIYQLSSETSASNEKDFAHFSHYRIKRLGAEPILDAISQVTGSPESFSSWIPVPPLRLPVGQKAAQLPDGDIESTVLEMFGRPSRDTPYEGDRNCEPTLRQALYVVSSDHLQWKIAGGQRIRQLLEGKKTAPEIVEELYLAALSRPPSDNEKQKALEYVDKNKADRGQALQDVMWTVLSTKEFIVNH